MTRQAIIADATKSAKITFWKKAIDAVESQKSYDITHVATHIFNSDVQLNVTAASVITPKEDFEVKEEVTILQESTKEIEIEQGMPEVLLKWTQISAELIAQ